MPSVATDVTSTTHLTEVVYLQGPYSNVGPIFQRMYKLGKEYKGGRCLDCGFYFDDPDAVPSSECRASIGAIVFEGVDENGEIALYDEY